MEVERASGDFTPTLEDVVTAVQTSLDQVAMDARAVHRKGISPETIEELFTVRFLKLRLEHRLDALLEGGLLNLSVCREERPVEMLARVLDEIRPECQRLGIECNAPIAASGATVRIDGHQLEEALRGLVEELVVGAGVDDVIHVTATEPGDGSIELTMRRQGKPVEPSLSRSGIALLLDADEASGVRLDVDHSGFRATIRPALENRRRTTRGPWLFPAPAA